MLSRWRIPRSAHADGAKAAAIDEALAKRGAHNLRTDVPRGWRKPGGGPPVSRNAACQLLEAVCAKPFDRSDTDWAAVLNLIDNPPLQFIPGLLSAIQQGRWRNARSPLAYVLIVARTEGRKLRHRGGEAQTLSIPRSLLEDEDGHRRYSHAALEAYFDHCDFEDGYPAPSCLETFNQSFLDFTSNRTITPIDWQLVGMAAGLDRAEIKLLKLRAKGKTRAELLAAADTPEGRRKVWADWRRLDRHFDRVKAVLWPADGREK